MRYGTLSEDISSDSNENNSNKKAETTTQNSMYFLDAVTDDKSKFVGEPQQQQSQQQQHKNVDNTEWRERKRNEYDTIGIRNCGTAPIRDDYNFRQNKSKLRMCNKTRKSYKHPKHD